MDRLAPPYLDPDQVRVYVIENEEWNAFAMGNYSIYVFSGLLEEMDDDEVAIVLGHELAHATHEHTRRQVKKQMWVQLGALGLLFAAEEIDNNVQRTIAQLVTQLGAVAYSSGYGATSRTRRIASACATPTRAASTSPRDRGSGSGSPSRGGEEPRRQLLLQRPLARLEACRHLEREIALNYRDGPKLEH